MTLAEVMKDLEQEYRTVLPVKTWAVVRLDGKAFHTWTRGLIKPFDPYMMRVMQDVTVELCKEVQGAVLGYTQSDEISIVFNDLSGPDSQMWLGGVVQKIVSISASIATAHFNAHWHDMRKLAYFDSRVFALSDRRVDEYLTWRMRDSRRNAVAAVAQYRFSPRELHRKSVAEMLEMLGAADTPELVLSAREYSGVVVEPEKQWAEVSYVRKDTGVEMSQTVERTNWKVEPIGFAVDGISV